MGWGSKEQQGTGEEGDGTREGQEVGGGAQHFGEVEGSGRGHRDRQPRGGERGSHLPLEHQMRLASRRTKTMNRNPTTAARPVSHGCRRRCSVAVEGRGGGSQRREGRAPQSERKKGARVAQIDGGLGKGLGLCFFFF